MSERLILLAKHPCDIAGCHETASRWILCNCKAVLFRCSAHGQNMMVERMQHCASGKAVSP